MRLLWPVKLFCFLPTTILFQVSMSTCRLHVPWMNSSERSSFATHMIPEYTSCLYILLFLKCPSYIERDEAIIWTRLLFKFSTKSQSVAHLVSLLPFLCVSFTLSLPFKNFVSARLPSASYWRRRRRRTLCIKSIKGQDTSTMQTFTCKSRHLVFRDWPG